MSRCLKLFKFALGSSQRANSRLLSSGRGLGSRTVGPFSEDGHVMQQQKQWSRNGMWNPSHPGLGLTQSSYYSTKEAEKVPLDTDKVLEAEKAPATEKVEEVENIQEAEDKDPEEPLHTIIQDTENVRGTFSKHEFQAETKKLLDIVARSLYSEKEVFIRELISNGSDALEKLRHKLITGGGDTAPMEIHLQTDQAKGTFTIQDTGVGMNQEELVANLGTIARSGSKAFLDALQSQAEASSSIIGQFGVGFYSAFMVADRVDVYSQSAEPSSPGYKWSSDGSGVFEIAEASGVRPGTKIVLHLKDDCKEFSAEDRVKEVVTKYSNFVSFPIFLNGRRLNTLQALWMMEPKSISEWQHEEFYRYVAQSYDKPRYTLHYRADAPVNIRSIFYVPDVKPSMFDVSREMGSSVALYSRKVLIQTKATEILPKWLRFLRGVVDSEDIPLNLSRELLQESTLIRKLRDVLQQRIIKFLMDQSKKEPEKYAKFFEDYGLFIREGIVTTQEQDVREDIGKLLRFESSALPAGQQTNLKEYGSRMKAGTRNIYYLCAPNRHLAHDQDSGAGDQTRSGYRIQVDPDGNATRAICYMERQLANLDPTRSGDAAGKYNRLDGGMSEVSSLHDDPHGRGGGRSQAPPLATVYDQDEAMSTISSVSTHGQRGRDDYPRRGGGPSPHMGAHGRARSMDNLDDIARRDRYPRDPRDPRDDYPPHRRDGGGARDRRGSDDDFSSRGGYDRGRDFDDRRRREPSPDNRRRGGSPVSGLQGRRSRSRDDLMAIERDRERGGGRGGGRDAYDDSFQREAMEKKRLGEQQRARSRERLDSDSERSDRGRTPRGPPPLPMSPPSNYPDRRYDDNYPAPLPPPYISDDESLTSSKKSNLRKNGAVSRESLVV